MIWRRLTAVFKRSRLDRELSEEIESHLAMQEEEFRRAGMSGSEARKAARREFGGVAQTMETYRERRGVAWLESTGKDVRYALRGLARSPGFTAAAVLSLALGIGANTAVFSLFHALMLRMLPVARPEELVVLFRTGGWGRGVSSYPLYLDLRKRSDLFADVAASNGPGKVRFQAHAGAHAELAAREFVTGNYFALLGVKPALGRLFTDDDNRTPQGHPLAVLSYDFWRGRFGADPSVIGRTITAGDQPLTVVGVAAPWFHGAVLDERAQFWVPTMMAMPAKDLMFEGTHWVWPIARLAPGVNRKRAQAAVDAIMQRHMEANYGRYPDAAFRRKALEQRLELRGAAGGLSRLREEFGGPLTVLMAAVGLVLLVASLNVANLLLARGAARGREMALRYSLGATRARLIRQGLTESALLAGAGCVVGAFFAFWGEAYILDFLPAGASAPFSTVPDAAVLAFTAGVSLASVLLFGLAPAWRSAAIDPAASLRTAGAGATQRPLLRRSLVVAQVAFSVVLVALAGLFGRSLAELRGIDPGFRNRGVVSFQLDFPNSWKKADALAARERCVARAETLPGVLSVSYSFPGPFLEGSADTTLRVPGSERTAKEPANVEIQYVAARHFETIGSPPLAGRDFARTDAAAGRAVAVVNEAFVRAFFGEGANPLGRILSFDKESTFIVGVVRDMTHYGLRKGAAPTVYVPFAQSDPGWPPSILVRASVPAAALIPALRREVENLGPGVALTEPRTIAQQIDEDIFQDRLLAALSGFFGVLALVLSAIGLYGVVAYGTARRTSEIGIRIALGARRPAVVWMVLRDALALVAIGLALGIPAALAAGRTVAAVLFDVKPADPATLFATACILASAGMVAAFLPARRAAAIEPVRVLRQE